MDDWELSYRFQLIDVIIVMFLKCGIKAFVIGVQYEGIPCSRDGLDGLPCIAVVMNELKKTVTFIIG